MANLFHSMKHSVLLIVFLLSTQNICAQNLDWVTELKTPDDSYSGLNNLLLIATENVGAVEYSFNDKAAEVTDPIITSATTTTFTENGTGTAYTIRATDDSAITYSLGTDNDEASFNVDATSGEVTFKASPDFEAPTDGNTDNDYVIRVKASDGVNEVSQLVTISVTDTDETPVIISTPVTSVKESIQYVYGISIESLSNVSYTLEAETLPDWMTLIGKNAVTKYAGSGEVGQDNGALLSATFNIPLGITRDEDDNLYVTDLFNHVIRKVSNSGHVSTIAGTGAIGYVDGTASEATFNEPSSIVIDSQGNLYVADRENHAVRKISLSGEVSTFAGNGQRGYMDGQGTSAQFSRPTELAIDSNDNIYVTDQSNYRVRKISPEGVVSTIAGNGDSGYVDGDGTIAQFSQLTGITVDLNGNIYVSDYDNHRIRKINPQGNVSTLAGSSTRSVIDGLGAEAAFYSPFGMAIDEKFNIYITDQRYVRKITPDGQVTTIAGSNQNGNTDGEGLSASFNEPHGVVIDSKGDLFITESSNNFIRRVSLKDHTLVGNPLNKVGIHNVSLKSRNSNGETDVQSFSVEVLDATPPVFTSASTATFTENEIGTAYTIAATDYSSITYALGASNDEGLFDVNETTGEVTFKVSPDFENPQDSDTNNSYVLEVLATDALDNSANFTVTISVTNADNEAPVFTSTPVTEVNENELYEYFVEVSDPDKDAVSLTLEEGPEWLNFSKDSNNMVSTLAGSGDNSTVDGIGQEASFSFLTRLSIDNNGDLYLGELGSKTIRKVSPNGNVTTLSVVSDGTRINGTLSESSFGEPNKILIDDSSGIKYVLDGSIIRKIDTEGNVSDFAGSGFFGNVDGQGTEARFTTLMGGAIDSQGNLYVADFGNHSIRKITSAGLVTTLAGSGTEGYADGTGIAASFNRPFDIAINSNDIVFVADEGNDRIRRIEPNGEVTTFAGSGVEGFLDGDSQNAMFFEPKALDFDSRDNLFVADWGNNRIRKITSSGDVSTIAGNGQGSYSDGNALEAGISGPIGLTVDSNDNIYVSTVNYRVRKITIEENYLLSGTAIYQSGIKGVELRVDDGFGGSATQIFNITVNDITPPVFTSPTTVTYTENETGTAYTIVATDANDITYSLGTGNDESFFNLTEGIVTFKASPDFETKSSYTIQVKANDGSNESAQTVTITIIDVDEIPPVFTSATAVNYAENGTGTAYTIVATDANDITYSLGTGNDEDFFDIASGVVTFKTSPDFETKSSYTIQVKANDGLNEATQNVTISVTNVNEAPTELFINNTSIEENNEVGDEISQLTTADQDAGDTHSYTLVSGSGDTDNASFEIVGNKLAAKSSFDFEAKASYSVRIKATDAGGLSFEDNFIITITNQAEAILRIEGGQSAETTNVGETSTLEISIFNDGDGVMEVSSIAYPDGFTGPATIDAIAPSASKSITVSFAPTEAKTYSGDIVISYNGGSGIKSVVAVAEVVTSIDNGFIDEVAVSIYPNPANDRITIDLSQYNGRPVEVSIFNESGHGLYKRSNIRHLTHDVEVSNYVQGIYIVLVKSEIGVVRKKLMIFR